MIRRYRQYRNGSKVPYNNLKLRKDAYVYSFFNFLFKCVI